jgi:glycosyltransferase involved in cell wall biosynthesis
MKLHILVDWQNSERFFLKKELSEMGDICVIYDIPNYTMKDRTIRLRIFNLYFKYVQLAFRAFKNSTDNDVLICWNFTTSIALGYLCKIYKQKRIIIALNIIAHPRNGMIDKLRQWIFQPVMNMPSYYITVNSELYIEEYSHRFKVAQEKFHVLSDPIQVHEDNLNHFSKGNYIFVGGEAQRDWETLFQASEYLPEISFVCIARKKYFNHNLVVPINMKLIFDTDEEMFYDYMKHSNLVIIPLKSHLPSGLIILLRAAMMLKPIIATNTPSVRNYIINGENGLLVEHGNPKELAEKIKLLNNDPNLNKKLAISLFEYINENFSQKSYAKKLKDIVYNISRNHLQKSV